MRSKIAVKRGSIDMDEDKKKIIQQEIMDNIELVEVRTQIMLLEPKCKKTLKSIF
jgi:hypothetical protein